MIVIQKYSTVVEANFKIQGGLIGGVRTEAGFAGLVGLTLTFSNPSGVCTFVLGGSTSGRLSFLEVKTQIESTPGLSNLVVMSVNNMFGFKHRVSGQSVHLDALLEPARSILGFVTNQEIVGVPLNGPTGFLPRYIHFVSETGAVYVSTEFTDVAQVQAQAFSGSYAISFSGEIATANG